MRTIPQDLASIKTWIQEMKSSTNELCAAVYEPEFKKKMAALPFDSVENARVSARWLNDDVKSLGFALSHAIIAKASSLHVTRSKNDKPVLLLESHGPVKNRVRKVIHMDDIGHLELVQMPKRIEGLSQHWTNRLGETLDPLGPRTER